MNTLPTKHIWLLDHQQYWRDFAKNSLENANFGVTAFDTDGGPRLYGHKAGQAPDLVVLGCGSIGRQERMLISHILGSGYDLVILCSVDLPISTVRQLFLQGAADVGEKTYDPVRLVTEINRALESLIPKDSYEAMEKRRASWKGKAAF